MTRSCFLGRPVHMTSFGMVSYYSPLYQRAQRLEAKYGRSIERYLEDWATFMFTKTGKVPHEIADAQPPPSLRGLVDRES